MKLKIKKGDQVQVITGEYKSKAPAKVLAVFPKANKVLVEGVNIRTKHTKPTNENPKGGIIKKEAPINISNLMVIDPKTGEPTRVGRKLNDKGQRVRYAVKSGEIID
ncbi:MAG: 50S ribosomal protein L24 [Bacteroidia bacterium]|nr:50S ribosomal protein L24 [Bacteroidia bacterium]